MIFKRRKLFFYSEDTVTYLEAKGFRLKTSLVTAAMTLVGIVVISYLNHIFGDQLGIEFLTFSSMKTENQLLKDEIKTLNNRVADLSDMMDKMVERDNQLRTAVNLPPVDNDTRKVGVGGAVEVNYIGVVSQDAGDLLSTSHQLLNKLDRELTFQQQSYEDIYRKSQSNKQLFASMPAIKPMVGEFSYHGYGIRPDPFLGVLRFHEGVDIHNDVGTPVYATGDGMVEFAGSTGSAYGVAVEVSHGFGYTTWYAHLLRPVVHIGQKVKRGTLIAYSGNSGRSTGPHLHYEVRYNGEKRNPVEYFVDDVDYAKIRRQLSSISKRK